MWWFQGQKWSHLVSDSTLAELHGFAQAVGIPRRAFQGDHYDVPQEYYDDMIAAGAVPAPSRELVRRLRAAGLRLSPQARRAATVASFGSAETGASWATPSSPTP